MQMTLNPETSKVSFLVFQKTLYDLKKRKSFKQGNFIFTYRQINSLKEFVRQK